MPTNLPPDYFEVEKKFRAAQTTAEKIEYLEEMLSIMPKHKGTDKLRADLRRRLSKLKASSGGKKTVSRRAASYHIDKEGAGQVVILGAANVGKSSLLTALTNATPEISDSPYTTWSPTPGMMTFENVQIQLIDTPPLDREYVEPELFNMVKRADMILLMVDLLADPFQQLQDALALLEEHHIYPMDHQENLGSDHRCTYKPIIVIGNKCDDEQCDENFEIFRSLLEGNFTLFAVSALTHRNLAQLTSEIYQRLQIIRVYTKAPGKEPDLTAPFVLKKGSTVEQLAVKIHQDFLRQLKAARVWGKAVYDGQLVGRDYILQEGDIVELIV